MMPPHEARRLFPFHFTNEAALVKKIVMPKYGLQQDEGTVVRWLKNEGEKVEKGEGLVEVETDKAVFEYESPEAGVLRKILVKEGSVVPVLSVIAVVTDSPDEPVDVDVPVPVASEESGGISGPSPPAPARRVRKHLNSAAFQVVSTSQEKALRDCTAGRLRP
jgi:pyruvate dehydrogenase E2 component (dihydrolipoamide acetyltransferase)